MQPTIEDARRRIVEADERGEAAEFDDVLTLLKNDPLISQCVATVMETLITRVENHPEECKQLCDDSDGGDPIILTPSTARAAVLKALDEGHEPGPALGRWLQVDRAAEALFRSVWQALTAPDTILHLQPAGLVATA